MIQRVQTQQVYLEFMSVTITIYLIFKVGEVIPM